MGFTAWAVTSKVPSSMWWHMPVTILSPHGSTSMSAPQLRELEVAVVVVHHLVVDVHVVVGEARVELQDLEDGLDRRRPRCP